MVRFWQLSSLSAKHNEKLCNYLILRQGKKKSKLIRKREDAEGWFSRKAALFLNFVVKHTFAILSQINIWKYLCSIKEISAETESYLNCNRHRK